MVPSRNLTVRPVVGAAPGAALCAGALVDAASTAPVEKNDVAQRPVNSRRVNSLLFMSLALWGSSSVAKVAAD